MQYARGGQDTFDMNEGCFSPGRLAWSASILAFHDMGTDDAPVGRAYSCCTLPGLVDELQHHARHARLFLSRRQLPDQTNV